jgi:hypothetical protein
MSIRLRSLIAGILAVAAILFVFRSYYGGNGLLFGDANFMWSGSLLRAELAQFLHVWRPAASGGTPSAIANESQNFILLQALFAPFGIPLSTVLVFPFLIAVGAFSFYSFARMLAGDRLGSVAGAAFFAGNPWIWDQILAGHVSILAAVCISPLLFYALLKVREGRAAFGFLLFALCAIELALDPRMSIFVFAGVVIAGISFFMRSRRTEPRQARNILAFALGAPVFAFVCNGPWTMLYALGANTNLVPFFYPPVEDLTVFSWYADFWHAVVLSAYFIHFSWTQADILGAWTFAPWYTAMIGLLLVPLVAASKRRLSFLLALPAIVLGIGLSMGTRALPPSVLYWVYAHVPLLSLLREPVKFGYLTALGASVLLAISMRRLSGTWRVIMTVAVVAVIAPVFAGRLSVPDGYGFQEFAARPAYLRMLQFLEQPARGHNFRIALFPPWLAEQSLTKDAFYTANPFVIQNEIPVIDAKLINTANATAEQAWQAFYGIYSGTDAHPAATLAEFGVKYVIVTAAVHLSAAAAVGSPFSAADDALNAAIIAEDPHFVLAYSDGGNKIYENTLFRSIYRGADTPLVAGSIPAILRQTLAAGTLGDAASPGDHKQPLPAGSLPIADSPLARCIDTHGELRAWNAYYSVTKHSNDAGYWIASDWLVSAPDSYRARILQRFPLPYAYTESSSQIEIPIEGAKRGSSVYAETAAAGSLATVSASIDNRRAAVFSVPNRLTWLDLGSIGAGAHTLHVGGSPAGVLLRRVVLDDGACAAAAGQRSAGTQLFIPGPTRTVTISVATRSTSVSLQRVPQDGASNNPAPWIIRTPPGAVAAAWDGLPVISGRPFSSFTGFHRLTFLAPAGMPLAGSWQSSDAPAHNITLRGGVWPQRADVSVTGVPADHGTIVQLLIQGKIPGARISISGAGTRTFTLGLDALRTPFVALPYMGPSYEISLITPANSAGTISFGADARVAGPPSPAAFFRIPSQAAAVVRAAPAPMGSPVASFVMTPEGNLQPPTPDTFEVPVYGRQGLTLRIKHLRAALPGTRAVVTAFYNSWLYPAPLKIADLEVSMRGSDYAIEVPSYPFADTVAFSILAAGDRQPALSLGGAELVASDRPNDGFVATIPRMHVSRGSAIAADDGAVERIALRNSNARYIIGAFTYEPQWSFDKHQHWEANGFGNLWPAGGGAIVYRLQSLYLGLLGIGLALWLLAILLFLVLLFREPRGKSMTSR